MIFKNTYIATKKSKIRRCLENWELGSMRSKPDPVDQPERTAHYDCAMCIVEMLHNTRHSRPTSLFRWGQGRIGGTYSLVGNIIIILYGWYRTNSHSLVRIISVGGNTYLGRSLLAIMHWNKSTEMAIGFNTCMLVALDLRASNQCSPAHDQPTIYWQKIFLNIHI